MAFTSFNFLVFLALVITVYYLVPKKYQWCVLLAASYGFFLSAGIPHLLFVLASTLFTYGAGRWMQKIRDDFQAQLKTLGDTVTKDQKKEMKKAVSAKIRRIQVLTVLINLGVLVCIKCMNFFIGNINNLLAFFTWDASIPTVNLLVPLGLSYYTFNSIGYLVDVGRGKLAAEKHLGKFALFTSFFPSIVQGPLFRFGDVGTQLQQEHPLQYNNIKNGALLILWGFFKKLVIADRVATIAATIFAPGFSYTGSHVFLAVLAYSFQIYCDFSGGTDITRGAAQMMGITLPENFNRPFFATSMADFWRRWHMSLGAWMREFVFYPIMLSKGVSGLSKKFRKRWGAYAGKMVPSVAAPMVVFFLIGIWHGLTWQYITNGLYNALLISSSVALTPVYDWLAAKLHVNRECFAFRLFQMLRTFVLLCFSRIIVKAPNLGEAMNMIKALFTHWDLKFLLGMDGTLFTDYGVTLRGFCIVFFSIGILFVIGVMQERGVKIRETLSSKPLVIRWGIILALLAFILVFGVYGPAYDSSSFIYGGF